MKLDEFYKKVVDACKAFEERRIPIHFEFKIEDLRDALEESSAVIGDLQKTNVILADNAVKLNREIETLKKRSSCTFSDDCLRVRQLKRKLEDVQTSMYADVVDANMENRKLNRALWFARATIAHNAIYKYQRLACKAEMDPQPHKWFCYINGEVYRTGKMNRMLEPYYWTEIWENVEHKCLKKAEEYK